MKIQVITTAAVTRATKAHETRIAVQGGSSTGRRMTSTIVTSANFSKAMQTRKHTAFVGAYLERVRQ